MFRKSVLRIHPILSVRPLGGWLYGRLHFDHRVCSVDCESFSQLGDSSAQNSIRRYAIQTESDSGICVEKFSGTSVEVPARKSTISKRPSGTAGTEYLNRTVLESRNISRPVTVGNVVTENSSGDVSFGFDEAQRITEEKLTCDQVSQKNSTNGASNSNSNQGGKLEILLSPEESREVDNFADVGLALRSSSSEDDGDVEKKASAQALALLEAALDAAEEEGGVVRKEDQLSLRVAVVGAPNAGKSLLTNKLVGTRVSAVSRKTNTTHREHLGVYTKGDTQLCFYDTPGLHLDIEGSPLRVDAQSRVQSAWQTVDTCEAVVVLVDAERQIRRPDRRVKKLIEKLGMEQVVDQKKILCLNKVDLIEQKRLLLPLAKEYESLPAFDRIFMISGLTGSGVKDVKDYLMQQAIASPWEEEAEYTNHRDIALEIVREQVFEHLHEELPHTTRQKLVSWKVLKDGSVRIQQLLLVAKKEHQKILVGKNGAVIGEIGIKARKELSTILGVTVHLVLDVKYMPGIE
ncbi:GTPase [Marchantia polymorpha subsp. ruderalis]|uniref:Era-type G domain-containing protein n=2 Tax=Marchantia polymorpha TaxID=3197 RepID=A0AAF6AKA7_MARPO|nr:hypothetical protein MARPO_0029s0109 [Marchantia polymorpha]BBM96877.1 hypothetical protein Mp_1g01380 [Marchantia polymorpha subsp. ruderalis]|eukprot:PTQ42606.1 hypothetical protein MARPO_0029s0109 [Marchantia polymorpha]